MKYYRYWYSGLIEEVEVIEETEKYVKVKGRVTRDAKEGIAGGYEKTYPAAKEKIISYLERKMIEYNEEISKYLSIYQKLV